MNQDPLAPLPTSAEAAIASGRIIEAVKILREVEGLDLKEAKDRIDLFVARNPELRERIDRARKEMRKTIIKWALVVDAIFVAVFLYWLYLR